MRIKSFFSSFANTYDNDTAERSRYSYSVPATSALFRRADIRKLELCHLLFPHYFPIKLYILCTLLYSAHSLALSSTTSDENMILSGPLTNPHSSKCESTYSSCLFRKVLHRRRSAPDPTLELGKALLGCCCAAP